MIWREEGPGGEALVRIRGHLDARAARDLRAFVDAECSSDVTVDVTHAEPTDYHGLLVLVYELAECHRVVRLRGLDARQIRVLRYCGIEPVQFGFFLLP